MVGVCIMERGKGKLSKLFQEFSQNGLWKASKEESIFYEESPC